MQKWVNKNLNKTDDERYEKMGKQHKFSEKQLAAEKTFWLVLHWRDPKVVEYTGKTKWLCESSMGSVKLKHFWQKECGWNESSGFMHEKKVFTGLGKKLSKNV